MSRYYYTDPFAAAWMAHHFNMRLQTNKCGYGEGTTTYLSLLEDAEQIRQWKWRHYIHPDSMKLLEPMVGDVIFTKLRDNFTSVEFIPSDLRAKEAGILIKRGAQIIQRNGIAFIWPEVES